MIRFFTGTRRLAVLGLTAGLAGLSACGISPREERDLGRQYAAEINRQLPIVEDPVVHRYINLLGKQIAQHVRRPFDYEFYVVNIEAVNAFAVPGGFVYVNRGLFESTRNMSELAGVLAHEIAHVDERHGIDQLERIQRAQIGLTAAYVLLGRAPTGLEHLLIEIGGALVFATYSRDAEREADARAIELLPQAGIDPRGLLTFLKFLLEERQRRPGTVEQWFATHPLTEARIRETEALIAQIPPQRLEGLTVDTQQYREVKARLRQYPPPPPEFR